MNTTQNQNTGQEGRAGSTNPQAGNGDAIRQGAQELRQGAEELGAKATEVAKEATREGQAHVDQYRSVAAQKVDTIAESVKAAAAKLEEGDAGRWSTQIAAMADSMSKFSQGLREKSADEMMHEVNRLARENPAIFVGSAVAIGFGLTRLVRATAQPRAPKETHRSQGPSHGSSSHSGTDDDAYTSSTITGSGDPRLAGTAQANSAYAAASPGSGSAYGSTIGTAGAGPSGSMGMGSDSHSAGGAGRGDNDGSKSS